MQKKSAFSFHFRVHCNFGEAKVTKKREQNKIKSFIFYAESVNFASVRRNITIPRRAYFGQKMLILVQKRNVFFLFSSENYNFAP